jgi:HIRAN domain
MLVREPHNPHDADAVAVQSLHGHGLGYVPRTETHRLPQPVTFGRVQSIGAEANTGNLGLTVSSSQPHRQLLVLAGCATGDEFVQKPTPSAARIIADVTAWLIMTR